MSVPAAAPGIPSAGGQPKRPRLPFELLNGGHRDGSLVKPSLLLGKAEEDAGHAEHGLAHDGEGRQAQVAVRGRTPGDDQGGEYREEDNRDDPRSGRLGARTPGGPEPFHAFEPVAAKPVDDPVAESEDSRLFGHAGCEGQVGVVVRPPQIGSRFRDRLHHACRWAAHQDPGRKQDPISPAASHQWK